MRIQPEGFGKTAFDNMIKDYSTLGSAVDDESPSLHLTLNPTLEVVGSGTDEVLANSVLLIVQPGASPHILTAAIITQHLRRIGAFWRIGHRTVKAFS